MFSKLLILTLCFSFALGYPGGAPEGVCDSMVPGHGVPVQTSASPYKLVLDKTKVSPKGEVVLTISGDKFKGFMVQGRKADKSIPPVGTFVQMGSETKLLKCHHDASTITQTSSGKKTSITLKWVAPAEKGKYVILVSMVKDASTYWVLQESAVIEVE